MGRGEEESVFPADLIDEPRAEDEGDRAFTFIVFDTLDAAESFAADVRGN